MTDRNERQILYPIGGRQMICIFCGKTEKELNGILVAAHHSCLGVCNLCTMEIAELVWIELIERRLDAEQDRHDNFLHWDKDLG